MEKTNKHKKVLEHLKTHKHITSMEAINLYGATRLAAIIFDLRKKYDIKTIDCIGKDKYGNTCRYADYKFIG